MDPANYKDIVSSRGYKYHYYAVPAKGDKLTVLFVHGFPQNARDWRLIAPTFQEKGYGIIAPDILGYGETDKPSDWRQYQYSALTKEIVEILDKEGVQKAVAIGHDWGAAVVSRLANFYPERFLAYAFMNVPYVAPNPDYDIDEFVALSKSVAGYENYGYWYFFAEEGADKVIVDHLDAFISATFIEDPSGFVDHFAQRGVLKQALLSDFKAKVGPFMEGEERQRFVDWVRKHGFAAPLCYYQAMVANGRKDDDATIPKDRLYPPVTAPIFYGAALDDRVCLPDLGKWSMTQEPFKNHSMTIKDFPGNHWLMMYPEYAAKVRTELLAWVEGTVAPAVKARV